MTAKNRAALIGKLHNALKKHFKPAPPSPGRPLMEHVLYASLLEDTPADLADEGFAKCEQEFFDWNEVRVTTVTELAEVLSRLPSANAAAIRLKKNLQSMFEAFYNFDIDYLKKENLGKAVAKFEAMAGMTPFVLSYLVQHGLGGHAIPIDKSAMKIMWLSGIVSDAEAESGKVPGLERTIPKNRAIEFSSLLHQAGIAFQANSKDKSVWDVLLSVNKDAKALHERPVAPPPSTSKKSKKSGTTVAPPPAAPTSGKSSTKPVAGAKSAVAAKPGTVKPTAAANAPVSEKTKTAKPSDSVKKPVEVAKPVEKSKPAAPAKTPAPKPSSLKTTPVKPVPTKSAKPEAKPPAVVKSPIAKPVSEKKAEPVKKPVSKSSTDNSKKVAASKPEPAKTSAAKPPVAKPPVAKPASAKSPASKPLSAKSVPAKPASKKTEVKAPAKKAPPAKLIPATKGVASTNKKLTKQKPR